MATSKNKYEQSSNRWRHYTVLGAGLLLFVALFVRLAQLQVFETDFLQVEGTKRTVREHNIDAYRGMIVDRNNEPLAVSTPVKSIWANPKQILKDHVDISSLAPLLNISPSQLNARIKQSGSKEFIYLERHMNPVMAKAISELNLPGIGIQQEFKRYYPAAEVASHVVGFTNIDEQGIEGVELAYDA